MAAPRTMEFWFDFASTYSYPAAMRIEPAARECAVPVAWKAFLLGPIFAAQGWTDSPFNLYPSKGRYMWRDLERTCAALEIPFARPSRFPRSGTTAARVAARFTAAPWLPEFVRRVYVANFAEDRDIASPDLIGGILGDLGPGRAALDEALSAPARPRLRAHTEEAAARGVFGAPTFLVGEEVFWGNDRLDAALAWSTAPPTQGRSADGAASITEP